MKRLAVKALVLMTFAAVGGVAPGARAPAQAQAQESAQAQAQESAPAGEEMTVPDPQRVIEDLVAKIDADLVEVGEMLFAEPDDEDLRALRTQLEATRAQLLRLLAELKQQNEIDDVGTTDGPDASAE